MRFLSILSKIRRHSICLELMQKSCKRIHPMRTFIDFKPRRLSTCAVINTKVNDRNHPEDEVEIDFAPVDDTSDWESSEGTCARDLLYKNSPDPLLNRIYNCVSVNELLNVFSANSDSYNCEHILQTVFVLWDLKKIFQDINSVNEVNLQKSSKQFVDKLHENENFQKLLHLIQLKLNSFDVDMGSYLLQYLTKIGVPIDANVPQLIAQNVEVELWKDFRLPAASRFLEAVFSDSGSLRRYFMSQRLVPHVFNHIGICDSPGSLGDLTQSLNKLHRLVPDDTLERYKERVTEFLDKGILTADDYKVAIKVMLFLNYPQWRGRNQRLITRCMLLIQGNMNAFDVNEIIILYDIFFRNQEPGLILNELQRSSSKYLQQLEDTVSPLKLNLFSTLIFFSSPHHRNYFQKMLVRFVGEYNDFENLMLVGRIMVYTKITDTDLCLRFWDKILRLVKNNHEIEDIDFINLSQFYMNFSIGIDNYRHRKVESEILNRLKTYDLLGDSIFYPQKMCKILNFVLLYDEDTKLLHHLVDQLETGWWEQLNYIDCLKMSVALRNFSQLEKRYTKNKHADRINKTLDKIIEKEKLNLKQDDLFKNNILLKSCIFKGSTLNGGDSSKMHELLLNYKTMDGMSSKKIEDVTYTLLYTNSLIPEIIDQMTDYVIEQNTNLLAFNVEKVLYLCYWLGYRPRNSEEFFNTATDVIIKDQERMTGLTLLHCGLSLCFFNKLPNFFVRSIFNTEFLDKLDAELANCYSKDKYPQRVRYKMMQLNRSVCLDCPESSVPWFHQKYVDELNKTLTKENRMFAKRIQQYLSEIVPPRALQENVITPYGYHIDYVIDLNSDSELISEGGESSSKLAIILVQQYAFTRINVQLLGKFQLKKRHLEMLGYKVVLLNFTDWVCLYYSKERLDFLSNLIWPNR